MTAQLQFEDTALSKERELDQAIDALVNRCASLSNEVLTLREEVQLLQHERDALVAKNSEALAKVESVIERLRTLDTAGSNNA